MDRVQTLRYFKAANTDRIRRLIELAPTRQRPLLQLLPLLFHTHAKGLPGYVETEMPVGIVDYQPDKDTLAKAKQLDISFSYRQKALRQYPILGLYLVNTYGQLHYPDHAYFRGWLVHKDSLSGEQRQALKQKIVLIQEWASSLGVSLEIHLFQEADLTHQSIPAFEREMFYCNGLILAGSVPYWWLLPPEHEADYQQVIAELKAQRMLAQASFMDFGPLRALDPLSIFTYAYQAAFRAIQEQSSALLDVLYWQHYLRADNDAKPSLAQLSKQQMYAQHPNMESELNLLKLHVIEHHTDPLHVELARQSFYLMSHEKLSRQHKQVAYPWRRDFIQQQVARWSWSEQQLAELDSLSQDFQSARRQFERVGTVIFNFLLQLTQFAEQNQLTVKTELQHLRLLYQLRYRPAADAIASLPLAMRPQTLNERLYLYRFADSQQWTVSQVPLQQASQQGLFQHPNLLHALSWAIANQLLKRSDWLSVTDQHQRLTTSTVVDLAQHLLRSTLPEDDIEISDASPATLKAKQLLLFINIEHQPSNKLMQQGLHLTSRQNDPLSYSSFKQSLIMSIEGVVQGGNGQWHSFSYHGETAVLEVLAMLLRWQPDLHLIDRTHIWCHTPTFSQAIMQRLSSLLADCWQHYALYPDQGKLLLGVGSHRYELSWHNQQSEYQRHLNGTDLWWALSQNLTAFVPTLLDSYLDSDGLLNKLLFYQAPHSLTVFIYTEKNTVVCYVVDELGNLLRQQYQHLNESTLLTHLRRFLTELKSSNQVAQLRFYRLTRQQQQWQLSALAAPATAKPYLPVHVTLSSMEQQATCAILCGQTWFEGKYEDSALFAQVRQLVLSLRKQIQNYPIYMDTLRIEDGQYHPVMVYLQQKQKIENSLNDD